MAPIDTSTAVYVSDMGASMALRSQNSRLREMAIADWRDWKVKRTLLAGTG